MLLPDVNVLICAFRSDLPQHEPLRGWLEGMLNGPQAYAMSDVVLSGFVRVVTNPRVFRQPDTIDAALAFADHLRSQPNCVPVAPGPRHWSIFCDLCRKAQTKGNLVADAFLAALAIEHGCEWITADRDYARFPGLRWKHPLE